MIFSNCVTSKNNLHGIKWQNFTLFSVGFWDPATQSADLEGALWCSPQFLCFFSISSHDCAFQDVWIPVNKHIYESTGVFQSATLMLLSTVQLKIISLWKVFFGKQWIIWQDGIWTILHKDGFFSNIIRKIALLCRPL